MQFRIIPISHSVALIYMGRGEPEINLHDQILTIETPGIKVNFTCGNGSGLGTAAAKIHHDEDILV